MSSMTVRLAYFTGGHFSECAAIVEERFDQKPQNEFL
jgi:hypothetical protein